MGPATSAALRMAGIPAALYLGIFFALNPHLGAAFSTHYFFGGADGYQNIWNLWWVNKALTEIGTQPWFTTFLHYPTGSTLIGHTLNPFNGVLAIPLLTVFTLVQTYNAIVVFSFVSGGLTAFWLCRAMTGAYAGSLVGGAIFTFSSYHFMHADGHLQLTAIEWLPLFVLWWIRFCERPSQGRGLAAALVLWLVALCDLYYFAYCVFAGAMFYLWHGRKTGDVLFLFRRDTLRAAAGFLVPASLTSGVLVVALVYQHATDPLTGTHSPRDLSMDLLSPFVWGYYWRFRDWVQPLWFPLAKYVTEASVYLGLSVIVLTVYAWRQRARVPVAYLGFWMCVALFFGVMSLGPNLRIAGVELSLGPRVSMMGHDDVNLLVLPYAVLWLVFPPWRLAGVPVRMMIMVQLVASIMAAGGVQALLTSTWKWRRPALAVILAWVVFDYVPAPLRLTETAMPPYVAVLRELPSGAVLDLASNGPLALYYQTVHEKPIAFGYISRTPTSVDAADQALAGMIRRGEWARIAAEHHFTYIVKRERAAEVMVRGLDGAPLPDIDDARRIYSDHGVSIYRF
ncbi:MAG: hypothetical protein WC815_07740 [Vicinamibacterales bacterium]|jgi:uncharacterized membrane protein